MFWCLMLREDSERRESERKGVFGVMNKVGSKERAIPTIYTIA